MPSDAQAMVDVAGAVRSAPATEAADAAAADAAAWPSVPRHPLVPVLAVGLPLLAVAKFGIGPQALVAAIASVVLTVLAAIDIEHRLLPNRIVLPATALLLALQVAFFPENALEWPLAGLAAAAFLVRRDAMGMGDIKLALLLGTIAGWQVFGAIVVGCLAIVPVALWMQMREGSIRNATLPFGPFLAFGTLLILFTS
jgi:leader peptidase (prepilin peptidase) / N-methyltransferase